MEKNLDEVVEILCPIMEENVDNVTDIGVKQSTRKRRKEKLPKHLRKVAELEETPKKQKQIKKKLEMQGGELQKIQKEKQKGGETL